MGKRKKKNKILEEMTPAMELSGFSIGSSILGGSLQSRIPAGVGNPLTAMGRTTGTFVSPLATLGVMSFTTKKLKKLNKKARRR